MKYRAYAIASASRYLGEIEAGSKEEAEDIAFTLESCSMALCHHCSKIDIGDIETIEVEEVEGKEES
jgi:hypothetical protein